MNQKITNIDEYFVELGKLMRSEDINESRRIIETLLKLSGRKMPKDAPDGWVEEFKAQMTDNFLDYMNSLGKPKS